MADEITFDNWDDGDLDFDGFDGMAEGVEDDRSVVAQAKDSFVDGLVTKSTDPTFVKGVIKDALPTGYKRTLDKAGEVGDTVATIYDESVGALRPAMTDFKHAAKKHLPKMEKFLPEGVFGKLDKFLTVEEDTSISRLRETRDSAIDVQLANIFRVNAEQNEESRQETALQNIVQEERDRTRHDASMDQAMLTTKGINRLVSYQDEVLANYQRKHLDLEFRKYYALTDLLDVSRAGYTDLNTRLDGITKNTALPEAVKQKMSEEYMRIARDSLLGDINEGVGEQLRNVFSGTLKNIRESVSETVSGIGEGLGSFSEMLTQMAEMSEMTEGMEGMGGGNMAVEMGGGLAGDLVAGALGRFASSRFGQFLANNETVRRTSALAEYGVENLDALMANLSSDQLEEMGLSYGMADALSNFIPGVRGEQLNVLNNYRERAGESASFDIATRKSIVEIIPEYLSRILQQTEIFNTGDSNTDRLVFNAERDRFTTLGQAVTDVRESVFSERDRVSMRDSIQDMIETIGADGLSPEAQNLLGIRLMRDSSKGKPFIPGDYASGEAFDFDDDSALVSEIMVFMEDRYDLTNGILNSDLEATERLLKDSRAFNRLREEETEIQRALNEFSVSGDKELLRQAGFLKESGTNDVFDYDRFYSDLGDVSAQSDEPGGTPGGPAPTRPIRPSGSGGESALSFDTTELVDATMSVRSSIYDVGEKIVNALQPTEKDSLGIDLSPTNQLLTTLNETSSSILDVTRMISEKEFSNFTVTKDDLATGLGGRFNIDTNKLGQRLEDAKTFVRNKTASGREMLSGAFDRAGEELNKARGRDLFVGGMKLPSFRVTEMMRGNYFDFETGEVITKVEDIKGAVRDRTGKIVLSAEDFAKGIYDAEGNSVKTRFLDWARTKPMEYLTQAQTGIMGAVNKVRAKATSAYKTVERYFNDIKDIYVPGSDEPVMLKQLIEKGAYFDKATGNVIRSFDDIKGEVVDAKGNIVLSFEQFKRGLVDFEGKTIDFRGLKDSVIQGGLEFATLAIAKGKKGYNYLKDLAGNAFERASGVFNDVMAYFQRRAEDKGMASNVEELTIVASNAYVTGLGDEQIELFRNMRTDLETATADATAAIGDMAEDVEEESTRASERIKDSVDPSSPLGDRIKDKVDVGVSKAKGLYEKTKNAFRPKDAEKAVDESKSAFKTAADSVTGAVAGLKEGKFNFNTDSITEALGNVTSTIKEHIPKPKKVAGDLDGDGIRDGSYQDQRRKEAEGKGGEGNRGLRAGFEDELLGALGGLGGDRQEEGGFLSSMKDKLFGKIGDLGSKVMGKGGKLLKAGLSAGGSALAAGGKALLGFAGKALPFLGKAALNIGRVALGPVGLAATAAYGAYKAGEYIAEGSDAEPLESLRYAQYGIDQNDSSQLRAIRRLEDYVYDDVTYDDQGRADVSPDYDEMFEEHGPDFGFNPTVAEHAQQFTDWFNSTFRPTLLSHASRAYAADEDVDLLDIDDEMDDEMKPDFVKDVYKKGQEFSGARQTPAFLDKPGTNEVESVYGTLSKDLGIEADVSSKPATKAAGAAAAVTTAKEATKGTGTDKLTAIPAPKIPDVDLSKPTVAPPDVPEKPVELKVPPLPLDIPTSVETASQPATEDISDDEVMEHVEEARERKMQTTAHQRRAADQRAAAQSNEMGNILARSLEQQMAMRMSLENIDASVTAMVESMQEKDSGGFFGSDEKESGDDIWERFNKARAKRAATAQQQAAATPVPMTNKPASELKG